MNLLSSKFYICTNVVYILQFVPLFFDRVYVTVFQNFLVDIKGPSLAFLPVLAFEGGTRRNIPKFEVPLYETKIFWWLD